MFRSRERAAADAVKQLQSALDDAEYLLDVTLKECEFPRRVAAMSNQWREIVAALSMHTKDDPIMITMARMYMEKRRHVQETQETIARLEKWIATVQKTTLEARIDTVMLDIEKPLRELDALRTEQRVLSTAESLLSARDRAAEKNAALDEAYAAAPVAAATAPLAVAGAEAQAQAQAQAVPVAAADEAEIRSLLLLAVQDNCGPLGRAVGEVQTPLPSAVLLPPTPMQMRAAQILRSL